ncbi:hypothetical protein AbraIFM66950_012093 [Aspergillus brasiliensis]|nr:hypothetical protein AbraIFM66950_012093 [Aspergillus brasiliensis]
MNPQSDGSNSSTNSKPCKRKPAALNAPRNVLSTQTGPHPLYPTATITQATIAALAVLVVVAVPETVSQLYLILRAGYPEEQEIPVVGMMVEVEGQRMVVVARVNPRREGY